MKQSNLAQLAESASKCGNKECSSSKPNCCTTTVRGSTVYYCTDRDCKSDDLSVTESDLEFP